MHKLNNDKNYLVSISNKHKINLTNTVEVQKPSEIFLNVNDQSRLQKNANFVFVS